MKRTICMAAMLLTAAVPSFAEVADFDDRAHGSTTS